MADSHKLKFSPLAAKFETLVVDTQASSLFFSRLPREIRRMIYEFVLACKPLVRVCPLPPLSLLSKSNNLSSLRFSFSIKGTVSLIPHYSKPQLSLGILRCCRQLYLEAYNIPIAINGWALKHKWASRRRGFISMPKLSNVPNWQLNLIREVHISTVASFRGDHALPHLLDFSEIIRRLEPVVDTIKVLRVTTYLDPQLTEIGMHHDRDWGIRKHNSEHHKVCALRRVTFIELYLADFLSLEELVLEIAASSYCSWSLQHMINQIAGMEFTGSNSKIFEAETRPDLDPLRQCPEMIQPDSGFPFGNTRYVPDYGQLVSRELKWVLKKHVK